MQHAVNGPRNVIGLFVQRDTQGQREGVAQSRSDDFPGAVAWVEGASKDTGLLSGADHLGEQILTIQIERTEKGGNFFIIGFDEGPMHDAEFEGVFAPYVDAMFRYMKGLDYVFNDNVMGQPRVKADWLGRGRNQEPTDPAMQQAYRQGFVEFWNAWRQIAPQLKIMGNADHELQPAAQTETRHTIL